jgi:hypothetical protein
VSRLPQDSHDRRSFDTPRLHHIIDYSEIVRVAVGGFTAALPRLVTGLVFLSVAHAAIRLVVVRNVLDRLCLADQEPVVSLGVVVAAVFLWFGVGLTLLKIAGTGDAAASLGTATGLAALGVSHALSSVTADVVAGVSLLGPGPVSGDRVETGGVAGCRAA